MPIIKGGGGGLDDKGGGGGEILGGGGGSSISSGPNADGKTGDLKDGLIERASALQVSRIQLAERFNENFSGTVSGLSTVNLEITLSRDDYTNGQCMVKLQGAPTTTSMGAWIHFTRVAARSKALTTQQHYEQVKFSTSFYTNRNTWRLGGYYRSLQDRLSRDFMSSISGAATDDRHIADCFLINDKLRVTLKNERVTGWVYAIQVLGTAYRGQGA